jgi:hypothetical protein
MKDKKGEKPARKECTKVTPQRRVLDYLRWGIVHTAARGLPEKPNL